MGKKSDPPPAPDYTQAAEKTAQSSQEAQTRADWTNRPTQITPWGTQSWSAEKAVDPATGQPITQWTGTTTLSPDQQKALDDQMSIQSGRSDIAQGMMGRLRSATEQPFNWNNMTPTAGVPATGDDTRQRVERGLLERMRPENQFQQQALEAQLGNMGLSRGSPAWNREMQRLQDQQQREQFNALEQGGVEQQRQFGMNTQAAEYQNRLRQQQIAEQIQQRNMPLNELNALLTGQQVGMPTMPSFNTSQSAGGANYNLAAQNQYNAGMDAFNAKQQQQQGMMSGISSIAGLGMMAFSDLRMKRNIVKIGTLPDGIGVYEYDIFDRHEIGVLAQEVQQTRPELVHAHDSGYLMVNYEGLLQ